MNDIMRELSTLKTTRTRFHKYYKANVSDDPKHFQGFMKLKFIPQLGVYLDFINSCNITACIYEGGFSVYVIDITKVDPLDIQAGMYSDIDGDIYIYDTIFNNYGVTKGKITKGIDPTKTHSFYWQRAISSALNHLNNFQT